METHYGSDRPAVNVKVYRSLWDVKFPLEDAPEGITREWIESLGEDRLDELFWDTCSFEWEMIAQDAAEIFGPHVKVEQDGRSGGWAVVTGLDDIADWDAVALAKWRRFEKYARAIAHGVPEQMVYSLACNEWETEQNERAEAAGLHRDPMPA